MTEEMKGPQRTFGPGDIPPQPQRQDSLRDQMRTVVRAARRLGCYDAEDWITQTWGFRKPNILRDANAGEVES